MLRLWQLLHLRWNPFRAFDAAEVPEIFQPWNGDVGELLQLVRGAVVELVGEPGSGKSTLAAALQLAAADRGIPARLIYLPPEFSPARCWLRAAPGELLIIDEVERLWWPIRHWLTRVRIRHLFGLLVTRHPTPDETEDLCYPGPPCGNERSSRGAQQACDRQHVGPACEDSLSRGRQERSSPLPGAERRAVKRRRARGAHRVIRLAPFDAQRVTRLYETRLRWSGCACPPPLDPAAADLLARLAGGNGRCVQWSLYELFQSRMREVPETISIELIELGVRRQRQAQASERPALLGGKP